MGIYSNNIKMDQLAVGSIDYAIEEVERIRPRCNQYVINDCVYHLKKAREALIQGLENPVNWETILQNVLLFKMLVDKKAECQPDC